MPSLTRLTLSQCLLVLRAVERRLGLDLRRLGCLESGRRVASLEASMVVRPLLVTPAGCLSLTYCQTVFFAPEVWLDAGPLALSVRPLATAASTWRKFCPLPFGPVSRSAHFTPTKHILSSLNVAASVARNDCPLHDLLVRRHPPQLPAQSQKSLMTPCLAAAIRCGSCSSQHHSKKTLPYGCDSFWLWLPRHL